LPVGAKPKNNLKKMGVDDTRKGLEAVLEFLAG